MLKKISSKLLVVIVLFSFIFPQNSDNIDIFPYLSVLLERAEADLSENVLNDVLNERVVITRFEATGINIEDKNRTYIIKSFEGMFEPNKFFHLVGSIEALKKTVVVDSELKIYSTEQLSEMERFSTELSADYYAIVNISGKDKTLQLTLIIRNSREHNIVWGKKWSTILRDGINSVNIGFYQGLTLPIGQYPFFFHFGLERKIFTFIDVGFYFDPGLNLLFPANSTSSVIGLNIATGGKASIDVLNIFNVPYINIEVPVYVKAGMAFFYYTSHTIPAIIGIPLLGFTARPGFEVIINRNYAIFFEFDIIGVGTAEHPRAIYSGFYYRFEF